MRKGLYVLIAVVLALTVIVSAIPSSAAVNPSFCEISGIGKMTTGASYSKDSRIGGDSDTKDMRWIDTYDDNVIKASQEGKMDGEIVEIEGKKMYELTANNLDDGVYLMSEYATSAFGKWTEGKTPGMRAPSGAETVSIYVDATDFTSDSPYVRLLIKEIAKKDGIGIPNAEQTMWSVANWLMDDSKENPVILTDMDGKETEVKTAGGNVNLPKQFKGYVTVKLDAFVMVWEDYNKQQGCTAISGENIMAVDVITSLWPNQGKIRFGEINLGYNGYKPTQKAIEYGMMQAENPKEAFNKEDKFPVINDPFTEESKAGESKAEESKAGESKVEESKAQESKAAESKAQESKAEKKAESKAEAKSGNDAKAKVPTTGDAGVAAMAAVLLISAGSAIVVAKRK